MTKNIFDYSTFKSQKDSLKILEMAILEKSVRFLWITRYINFNSSKITQGIFLDFSKAIDTIDHNILIRKLTFYNFTDNSKDFIQCYLANRKQFVQINHANSSFLTLKKGVPHDWWLIDDYFNANLNTLENVYRPSTVFNFYLFIYFFFILVLAS